MKSTEFLSNLAVIAHKGQKAVVNGNVIEVSEVGRVNFATVSTAEIKGFPTSYFKNDTSLLKDEFVLPVILIDGEAATLEDLEAIAGKNDTEVLHTLSAEDLDNNPDLAEAGLTVGEVVVIEAATKVETEMQVEFIEGDAVEETVAEAPVVVEEPAIEVVPENTAPIEETAEEVATVEEAVVIEEPVVEAPIVEEPAAEEAVVETPEVFAEPIVEEAPATDPLSEI